MFDWKLIFSKIFNKKTIIVAIMIVITFFSGKMIYKSRNYAEPAKSPRDCVEKYLESAKENLNIKKMDKYVEGGESVDFSRMFTLMESRGRNDYLADIVNNANEKFYKKLLNTLSPQASKIKYKICSEEQGEYEMEDGYYNLTKIGVEITYIDESKIFEKAAEESDFDTDKSGSDLWNKDEFLQVLKKELKNQENFSYDTTKVYFYLWGNEIVGIENLGNVFYCNYPEYVEGL